MPSTSSARALVSSAARLSTATSRTIPATAARRLSTTPNPNNTSSQQSHQDHSDSVIDPIMERLWAFGRSVSISAAATSQNSGATQQQQQQEQQKSGDRSGRGTEMYLDGVVRDPIVEKFFGPKA